jgi:putative Mg2+ transporter-C (MgtC) family protein
VTWADLLGRWFPEDVGMFLDMFVDSVVCLGVAAICGYVVGRERETSAKPAGIRTHILVCLGAAMFVHLGLVGHRVGGLGTIADFNRLIQSIATGIGFLGAGAIFRARDTVRGITTAASIWVMGAIGAAAGAGAIFLAVLLTILTYLVLRWSGERLAVEERIEEKIEDAIESVSKED